MKKFSLILLALLLSFSIFGQEPSGYYDSANGKTGEQLQAALYDIINDHTVISYDGLWNAFKTSDKKANGKVWDMYSDVPGGTPAYEFTFTNDQCGSYSGEGDCYNREHSFPKSWFGDASPMYSDMFHLYPTDGYVNGRRSNYPFGEVGSASWTSTNGSKLGSSNYPGYSGTVFEPIDEYKGDFARSYFYMVTRYYNVVANWNTPMLNGTDFPAFSTWAKNMLMEWHVQDPVSEKEISRNNVIYTSYQHNRNPYIDHPEYVNMVWGSGTQFTITASAGSNGSISPSGTVTVNQGQSQTFTITPSSGYHISDVKVDNVSVGAVASYTFTNITANHTINATFAVNTYTITASAGANGSISPSGTVTVNYGQSQAFTITPSAGYHVNDVLVDGASVGAVTSYTFSNVTANHTITASFSNTYTITASAGQNGSIAPNGAVTVIQNQSQAFTITSNTGYHIASLLVDGSSVSDALNDASYSYTFTNVTANHTIAVTFAINTYMLTYAAGDNGTLTGTTSQTVNYGASGTAVTAVPNTGYHFEKWSDENTDNPRIDINVTANISVTALFVINTHTITASASSYGTISPAGDVTVNHEADQTFTITPNTDCYIIGVLVDGVSVGLVTSYTFSNVISDHTIVANFSNVAPATYTITASSGENGSISPSGEISVTENDNKTFNITPAENYQVADVLVDGESVGAVSSYTFVGVTANHTIHASFEILTYTITATASENGSISPSGDVEVEQGADQTFTVTPNEGYHILDVAIDDVSVGAVSTYTFENVTVNHTIEADFEVNTFIITATANENGTISPSGDVEVNYGDDALFTFTPNEGFQVADVLVDDESVGAIPSYTFESINGDHTIEVFFEVKTYIISAAAGEHGSISPSGEISVEHGGSQIFTITADADYLIVDVLVNNQSVGPVTSYTFENVTSNHTIEASFSNARYIITATANENGSISPSGEVAVGSGEDKTFTITPNPGYIISNVLVNSTSIGTVETYTFENVLSDQTIEAFFEITQVTLTLSVAGEGTIDVNDEPYATPIIVNYGTVLSLDAIPALYWQFDSWSGDQSGRDTPMNVTMNGNKSITATFTEIPDLQFTLTINIIGNGSVQVNDETYISPMIIDKASVLSLSAIPDNGWQFFEWSGDVTGRDTPVTLTMTSDKTVTTTFTEITGIDQSIGENVEIYPNPFGTHLTIKNAEKVARLTILNILGQKVFTTEHNGSHQITIEANTLQKGIYVASIHLLNGETIVKRIIKE